MMKTSAVRVRKMLVTAGCFSTSISREVQDLHKKGLSLSEIMKSTGLGRASVYSYLPYTKGVYKLDDPSLNAEQNRVFRKRNQSCEDLAEHAGKEDAMDYLWKAICAFEGYPFLMDGSVIIRYSVDGDEIVFEKNHIHRSVVEEAYQIARAIQEKEGCVLNAGCLGCCNAKELYSVFLRIGACRCAKS